MSLKSMKEQQATNLLKDEEMAPYLGDEKKRTNTEREELTTLYQQLQKTVKDLEHTETELLVRLKPVESYLSVLLKESMQKEIAITTELERIGAVSKDLHEQMTSTLKRSIDDLKNGNKDLKTDTDKQLLFLAESMDRLNNDLAKNREAMKQELEQNRVTITNKLSEIDRNNKQSMDEISHATWKSVQKARKHALISDWIDVGRIYDASL